MLPSSHRVVSSGVFHRHVYLIKNWSIHAAASLLQLLPCCPCLTSVFCLKVAVAFGWTSRAGSVSSPVSITMRDNTQFIMVAMLFSCVALSAMMQWLSKAGESLTDNNSVGSDWLVKNQSRTARMQARSCIRTINLLLILLTGSRKRDTLVVTIRQHLLTGNQLSERL